MAPRTKGTDREVSAVASRIKPVEDVNPYAKVLAYGPNGSGKTRFAASAPKCLIVDCNEEGTRSAVGSGARAFPASSWDDIGQVYWYLKSGKHPYQSVAIDTITAMQQMAMSFVLDEKEERDPSAERRMPDKRSYGRAGELVKGMLLAYRNLDMHVIFTAQVRTIKDEDTGEVTEYAVDLPGGTRGTAMGAVGVIGYMRRQEVRRRDPKTKKVRKVLADTMTLRPSDEFMYLKDRTNLLGDQLINPTMPKVLKAWADTDSEEE